MRQWRKRALSAWRRHGPLRFFQLAVYNAWYELQFARRRARLNGMISTSRTAPTLHKSSRWAVSISNRPMRDTPGDISRVRLSS